MFDTFERFGERISELVIRTAMYQLDFLELNAFSYEVILHIDMFGSLIDGRIIGEINCASIVNTNSNGLWILQKPDVRDKSR